MSTPTTTDPIVRALIDVSAGRITHDSNGWSRAGETLHQSDPFAAALETAANQGLLTLTGISRIQLSHAGNDVLNAEPTR